MNPSPDACPSNSGMDIEDREDTILWLLKVRSVGAILLRSHIDVDGKWTFDGVSVFSLEDIYK